MRRRWFIFSSIPNQQYLKQDLAAAFSTALVALPLALGIANACNFSPMAGVIAAVSGGIVGSLAGGGRLTIKGPGAGLIGIILIALETLGSVQEVLAASLVAGILMMLAGFLKLGKIAQQLPLSVINGFLAAIGIIILSKELYFGLIGSASPVSNPLAVIWSIKDHSLHPLNCCILVLCLLLLFIGSGPKASVFKKLPAPLWVVVLGIGFVFVFDFEQSRSVVWAGLEFQIGPHLLVNIPQKLADNLLFPDFSSCTTFKFWNMAFSIAMIAIITSLTCAKGVDKIDPEKQISNLDKDIVAAGLATCVAASIGGLPVITVIVRSTVSVQNGAKTKSANFYHGLIMVGMIGLLSPYLSMIPRAALAAILVYTGWTLAAPAQLKKTWKKGWDQFIFLMLTLIVTLMYNQIAGVLVGVTAVLMMHLLILKINPFHFYKQLRASRITISKDVDHYRIKMEGIINFTKLHQIQSLLQTIPYNNILVIDMQSAKIVDRTIIEYLEEQVPELDWMGRIKYGSVYRGSLFDKKH